MEEKVDNMLELGLITSLRICGRYLYFQAGEKTGQKRILTTLLRFGNKTQRELQRIKDIKSASLSEILAKIEAEGFIARMKSDEDKRQVELRLTEEGRKTAVRYKEEYACMAKELFEDLTDEEKEQLFTLLEKLVKKWADRGGMK